MNANNELEAITPDDLSQMKAFIDANRTLTTPFDYVIEGKTGELDRIQAHATMLEWEAAGATWWVEALWEATGDQVITRLGQKPPT